MKMIHLLSVVACAAATCAAADDVADDAGSVAKASPRDVLRQFGESWDESVWTQENPRNPHGYMRISDDLGWKARMQALQSLVAIGESAVPDLVDALMSESTPERILAAQALGYLAPHVPVSPLLQTAGSDADPAVRLYAVDAIGMQGDKQVDLDWESLLNNESNRDVRKHISYAMERKQQALDPAVVRQLIEWDAGTMDTASVGQPAPDFTLQSATGDTVRLSNFRGKRAVVLVFIYGDT